MNHDGERTLKTIKACADAMNISYGWLRRAVASGRIPSFSLGSRALVYMDDVQKALPKPGSVKIGAVVKHTGLTESAIRRAINAGWMPFDRIGKAYVFDLDAVDAAIQSRMNDKNIQK